MADHSGGGLAPALKRAALAAAGVALGSYWLDGIHYDDSVALAIVVLALGVFSAVLKPLLVLLALPFVVLTLGLGLLFINALLYLLAAKVVPGFYVDSFGAAFFGALIISLLHVIFSGWINGGPRRRGKPPPEGLPSARGRQGRDKDVIDI